MTLRSILVVALTVVFCNQTALCRAWAPYRVVEGSECSSIVIPARFYSVAKVPEKISTTIIGSERRCDKPVASSRMCRREISKGANHAFVLPCNSSFSRTLRSASSWSHISAFLRHPVISISPAIIT